MIQTKRLASTALPLMLLAGCASRAGVAYIEIENDQSGGGGRAAEPVYVDPRVEIVQNEYRRSSGDAGANIRQTIRVKGPIMIVPAPVGR